MIAHAVSWLVFVALTRAKEAPESPFKIENPQLVATEGSCVEIQCTVDSSVAVENAYWFWIKDPVWADKTKNFTGTCVYSTNTEERPVSPDFADRVTYIGSNSMLWTENEQSEPKLCSVLICNLNKTDSGTYFFRFIKKDTPNDIKWHSNMVTLRVEDNPCLISFEKPPVVKESDRVTLRCSTLRNCTFEPRIKNAGTSAAFENDNKTTTFIFSASRDDDGREYSCYLEKHKDKYLVSNVTLSVEYAPRQTQITSTPSSNVKEGDSLSLKCISSGNPKPTFTWFKGNRKRVSGAEWSITSVTDEDSGGYRCEARNRHGAKSVTNNISVKYAPKVEIRWDPPLFESKGSSHTLREGEEMVLKCHVMKSNPWPKGYVWFEDGQQIYQGETYNQPSTPGIYTCKATNEVGAGTSPQLEIIVEYTPRKPQISVPSVNVKVNHPLTLQCKTNAIPTIQNFDWEFSITEQTSFQSQWHRSTEELILDAVKKADHGYYRCRGINRIGTGEWSKPELIHVLYPPTSLLLQMPTEVTEGVITTITCIVDSYPPSNLTLKRTSITHHQPEAWSVKDCYGNNTFIHRFAASWTHEGFYTCHANNSEGRQESSQSKLVVKYPPKIVTVHGQPTLDDVKENTQLTLQCVAHSHPPLTTVTWMKEASGKFEALENYNHSSKDFTLMSLKPSDSGKYKCVAKNNIGSGESQPVHIRVKYAPKNITITRVAEWNRPDGLQAVTLRCNSQSFPPIETYSWYKKVEGGRDKKVSDDRNLTVLSKDAGHYYCTAENEIDKIKSHTELMFLGWGWIKIVVIIICPFILVFFFVLYVRRNWNKASRQTSSRTQPRWSCLACMGRRPGTRGRIQLNEYVIGLLPGQLTDHPHEPAPDSTAASDTQCVYSTVALPFGDQGPDWYRQQGGHTEDPSVNYASLNFGNKQNKTRTDAVYAVVSKRVSNNKGAQERPEYYKNLATAQHKQATSSSESDTSEDEYDLSYTKGAQEGPECYENMATAQHKQAPSSSDSDTSEDEDELSYSKVSFTPNPGHQRANRDSSSSEEATQYSDIRI